MKFGVKKAGEKTEQPEITEQPETGQDVPFVPYSPLF
jgi:hypothetical protein